MTVPVAGEQGVWFTEGSKVNPDTTAILATTGQVAKVSDYMAHVLITTDATAAINIQHRAADDLSTITSANKAGEQRVFLQANQQAEFIMFWRPTDVNQRLRAIPNATVTGNVSVSIFLQKTA